MFPKTEKRCCVFKDYSVTFVLISISKFSVFFAAKSTGSPTNWLENVAKISVSIDKTVVFRSVVHCA